MRNSRDLIPVGGEYLGALAEAGIEVEMIADFMEAEQLTREMGKDALTPKLSGGFNDYTEESGFWLLMKENGTHVASVASRFDNVGRESMGGSMIRTMRRHYAHEAGQTILDSPMRSRPDFTGAWPISASFTCGPSGAARGRNFAISSCCCIPASPRNGRWTGSTP